MMLSRISGGGLRWTTILVTILQISTTACASSRRVAVNFFGLTRSLSLTFDSIQRNLLQPLEDAGYQVDTFVHTYNLTALNNAWSGESTTLNTTEWRLLAPKEYFQTDQDAFLARRRAEMEACSKIGHGWNYIPSDKFDIAYNLFCQLNSIQEVSRLWQKHHASEPYHAVVFARPDVVYNCRLPVEMLEALESDEAIIPDHSHYTGVNDRFMMSGPDVARAYGDRIDFTLEHCTGQPLHAEKYMAYWAKTRGFRFRFMPHFDFYRLRSNGEVAGADAMLLQGCDVSELYKMKLPSDLRLRVKNYRREFFHETQGWAA